MQQFIYVLVPIILIVCRIHNELVSFVSFVPKRRSGRLISLTKPLSFNQPTCDYDSLQPRRKGTENGRGPNYASCQLSNHVVIIKHKYGSVHGLYGVKGWLVNELIQHGVNFKIFNDLKPHDYFGDNNKNKKDCNDEFKAESEVMMRELGLSVEDLKE
uniref:uncharacterized protein LOC122580953 n=1 Tax=Erigeron canadensis TaxID=72917 RepID=UPI001CB9D122|nr:uncharacterized protein LOC122580953 [Erigeron canadensis]